MERAMKNIFYVFGNICEVKAIEYLIKYVGECNEISGIGEMISDPIWHIYNIYGRESNK